MAHVDSPPNSSPETNEILQSLSPQGLETFLAEFSKPLHSSTLLWGESKTAKSVMAYLYTIRHASEDGAIIYSLEPSFFSESGAGYGIPVESALTYTTILKKPILLAHITDTRRMVRFTRAMARSMRRDGKRYNVCVDSLSHIASIVTADVLAESDSPLSATPVYVQVIRTIASLVADATKERGMRAVFVAQRGKTVGSTYIDNKTDIPRYATAVEYYIDTNIKTELVEARQDGGVRARLSVILQRRSTDELGKVLSYQTVLYSITVEAQALMVETENDEYLVLLPPETLGGDVDEETYLEKAVETFPVLKRRISPDSDYIAIHTHTAEKFVGVERLTGWRKK